MPREHDWPVELIVDLACAKFGPLRDGRGPLSYKEVFLQFESELNKVDPNISKISVEAAVKAVERKILEAFEQGWVRMQRNGIIPHYHRDQTREHRVKTAFRLSHPRLERVIVADITNPYQAPDRGRSTERQKRYGEIVHEQLGHALAKAITQADRLFRPGDIVSVGSGRATHAVISSLAQFSPLKVDEITIMSLTGSLFIHETDIPSEFLLDADIHTALLAQRFDGRVHTLPITYSIAHDPDNLAGLKNKTALGKRYEKNIPTHAIVGLGVLALRHRFVEEVKRREAQSKEMNMDPNAIGSPYYGPVTLPEATYVDLLWLVTQSELLNAQCKTQCKFEFYWPIADVCNRLFFVPPPDGLSVDNENEIITCIDRVNKSLLTITKTQLDKVGTVMLVTGTEDKSWALYQLLIRNIPKIDTLCIDSVAADEIVKYATT
jgi:DNA-binding transcriptional regulator LsrR (DeoR family)